MKLKTIFHNKISFFLGVLCVSACFLACFNMPLSKAEADNYDYSFSNDNYTLNAKDIFTKVIGNPNELETNYLNGLDYKISYSQNPNKENVITSVIGDKLYVFAYDYSATGTNGKPITWTPSTFTYNGASYDFVLEDDHYLGIANNYDSSKNDVVVNYSFDVELKNEDAEAIYNGAYNYAKEQYEIKTEQEAEYNEALANYNQYLLDLEAYQQNKNEWDEYDAAEEAYNIYLSKYQEYETKYANYVQNKAAWDQYNSDYAKYTKYLSDLAYYNEHHEQNLEEYNNFYPNYQKFEYRLKAMNLIYKPMQPMERTIYDQVMGDSVTQVLNRKSDLLAFGVDESVVDQAYTATLELRILFEDYKAKQTDQQRYSYYKNNYSVIKANVENLLRALDKLYRSNLVPEAINSMGQDKTPKYLNLVAQLAYLANAIDDKNVYNYEGWNGISGTLKPPGAKLINDDWTIVGVNWKNYLTGEEFIDYNGENFKAYPSEANFPTEIVTLLEEPEPVEEPVAPTEILTEPVAPAVVNQPVAPTVKLDKPALVEEPQIEDYLTSSENDYAYAAAYASGDLQKRKVLGEQEFVTIDCNASINVLDKLQKVCRFLDYDGSYITQNFFVDHPIYSGNTPFREQDETYNDYLFQNWDDLNNNSVNLETINNSCELKAHYLGRNLDNFDITFILGDRTEVINCLVGYLPKVPTDLSVPETDEHFYVFTGWDKELEIVNKTNTYVAQYEEKNKYIVEFDVNGVVTSQLVKEGELPIVPSDLSKPDSGDNYYVFSGWDKTIEATSKNEKYTAQFDEKVYINIKWVIEGKETIEKYKEGEIVSYKGSEPSKNNQGEYYFDFASWDSELGFIASENKTITALFDQKRFINVTWTTHDDTIVRTYRQDEIIDAPKVTFYFDDCYIYNFLGFEKQSQSTNYDIYYLAKYNKDYILYSHNVGVRIYAQNNIINIYLDDQKDIDLTPLFNLFDQGYPQGDLKIIGNSYSISISKLQLQLLINKGCHTISLYYDDLGNKEYAFSVDILDAEDYKIANLDNIVIGLSLNGTFDSLRSYVYIGEDKQNAEITNNSVNLNVKSNTNYELYPIYTGTILEFDGAKITANTVSGRFGTEIVLEYTLNPGYEFQNFIVSETNGQLCNTNEKYTIKGYDFTIGIALSRIKFTIHFYVDDEIYATSYVYYGDKIVPPEYVSKLPTETTRFVFVGWDKNVEIAYQNEDFYAIFNEVEIPRPPKNNKVSVITVVEIIAVSLLGVGLIVALLIIFRKKIFKRL